jgi:ABC-type transport system involved in multi-copper enzyme maturation permease subunit
MRQICTLATIVWLEMIRRKELSVLFILLATLLASLLSFDVFGLSQVSGYVKDMGLLAVWILSWILMVNTSVRQLPQEEQRGTLLPLLAKPVSRGTLIIGKWLGAWSITSLSLLCFYLTVWLAVWIKGGTFTTMILVQAILLHMAALAIISAVGLALSTRLNQDAAAVTTYLLTGAGFLLLPRIPTVLVEAKGATSYILYTLYYLFPHFELFDLRRRLVHDWGTANWLTIAEIILYAALMTTVFLTLAWLGFRKRRFSRGDRL